MIPIMKIEPLSADNYQEIARLAFALWPDAVTQGKLQKLIHAAYCLFVNNMLDSLGFLLHGYLIDTQ